MNEQGSRPRPAVLIICDGFGVAPKAPGNAIKNAKTPRIDQLIAHYPSMTLRASGTEVGLSWGEMGNSEVGHLAIGAGRVYYQMYPRINNSIENGEFMKNEAFLKAINHAKENKSTLHLAGMISPGGVHSMDLHCYALLDLCKREKIKDVALHVFLDGRDTVYNSALDFVTSLQEKIDEVSIGKIATISGRFYAMDRDNRWERTEKTYQAMVLGQGNRSDDPLAAIQKSYNSNVFDEEFVPTVITEKSEPVATVRDKDAIIFFNFRADRMRQITKAFVLPEFDKFQRQQINPMVVTMSEYEKGLPVDVAFPTQLINNCLAEVLSKNGLKQLHIAETEKYAHVTFFLNGTREKPFENEEREIIPSPRVDSYSQTPQMSANEITDHVMKAIDSEKFDVIILNFANADMVGHTGDFEATVQAVETIDSNIGKIVDSTLEKNGVVFITADHGNAEEVKNVRTGEMDKEHATNPVPFIIVGKQFENQPGPNGVIPNSDLSLVPPVGMLADVAPTILSVLNLEQPPDMTGQALI